MIIHHQRHHQQPCHHLKFLLIPLFLFPSWPLLPATRLETQGLSLTLSLLHSPCSVAFRAELPCLLSLTVHLPAAFPAQPSLCAFYLELPTRLPSYKITSFSTSLIRKVKAKCESESCSVMSNSLWPHGLYSPWNSPGQNTEVGSLSLLQGVLPTKGSNWGHPHGRWILYQLSHQGSPRILE